MLTRLHWTLVAALGAVVAFGGTWLALPLLQGARRDVAEEVSLELERARRILDNYFASLTYQGLLRDQLASANVEVEADALSTEAQDEYQQLHTALWEAYTPRDWPNGDSPRPARANYGNLVAQIRQGLDASGQLLVDNQRLLDEALQVVNRALAVSKGGQSARSDAEANRLKGTVLYHMAQARRLAAQILRREALKHRTTLLDLASEAEVAKLGQQIASMSEVDSQIERLKAKEEEVAASLSENREALAAVGEKIADLEGRLQAAVARRNEARRGMEVLLTEGVDFSDPRGGETFETQLMELDAAFRQADREAHALKHGSYVDARIDATGDYLKGSYVGVPSGEGLAIEYGVEHYRDRRTILAEKISGQQSALENLQSGIARLKAMKNGFLQAQADAEKRAADSRARAQEVYAELNRIDSEAFVEEEKGLDLARQSAGAFRQAAQYADQWIREARDRTQGLSPEARDRSPFSRRLQDEWMRGFAATEEADALFAQAWLNYDRYRAALKNTEILTKVKPILALTEADPQSEQEKAGEARVDGLQAIADAVKILERAHRETDRHWTVVAQAAGATYLLYLFGQDEYLKDTIAAYRSAVKGREDEAFAQVFVSRLQYLEQRP